MARHRHKRRRARPDAALQQAQLESSVRFGPEAFQLSELLHQARSDYLTQVKIERGTARAVKASTRATIPKTKKDYADSLKFGRQQQKVVNQKLGELSPAADDIKAASVRESSGAQRRLRESQANATAELRDRISQADAAAAFGVTSAKSQYASDRSQIGRQLLNLARQKGTFTIADAQALRKADRQFKLGLRGQNITRRGQNLSHKDRIATNRRLRSKDRALSRKDRYQRRHKLGPYKPAAGRRGRAPRAETVGSHNIKSLVNDLRGTIRGLKGHKNGHQIRQLALSSKASSKPGFRTALNTAMDLEYRGFVSRPNVLALRDAGVSHIRWPKRPPKRRKPRGRKAYSGIVIRGRV